jgi:hypothetical protein
VTEHEHSWIAATLVHLTSAEADLVASDEASLADVATFAPSEIIGPPCSACFTFLPEMKQSSRSE